MASTRTTYETPQSALAVPADIPGVRRRPDGTPVQSEASNHHITGERRGPWLVVRETPYLPEDSDETEKYYDYYLEGITDGWQPCEYYSGPVGESPDSKKFGLWYHAKRWATDLRKRHREAARPPGIVSHVDGDEPLEKDEPSPAETSPWDEFVRHGQELINSGQMDSKELENKVAIGRKLSEAREAVVSDVEDWASLVKSGITGRLIFSMRQTELRDWIDTSPDEALMTLQAIWTQDDSSVFQRVRTFSKLLPRSVVSGAGVRTNVASVLLMGLDAQRYPPFMRESFNTAYGRTGYGQPERDADEAALYGHALGFLDRLIEEASARGLILHHRLEAQSLVHGLHRLRGRTLFSDQGPEDDNSNVSKPEAAGEQQPNEVADLEMLADELLLKVDFLRRIETLLEDKRQIIFQGPPGTGKTFVARKLAACLAGAEDRVRLVQFHPSYAYEDFVQGFRPTLISGQPGFVLKDGPLLEMAKMALREPGANYFLVIDEINRGNLAKVFGELYFLLEYRDEPMQLQYSNTTFSLPDNLYIIGTMNTADRSIALVDLALRRRFHFVEFHPDKWPVEGLLRRWLREKAPGMEWVAGIVDRANEKLRAGGDSEAAIGPSYFMKSGLTNEQVRLIWEHNVRPYIEEQLYGQQERLAEFDLNALRREVGGSAESADAGNDHSIPEYLNSGLWCNEHGEGLRSTRYEQDFTCAADSHTIAAGEKLYEFYTECPASLRYAQHNKGLMYCANHVKEHVDVTRWADQAACTRVPEKLPPDERSRPNE